MSRATRTLAAPANVAKAAPMRRAVSASNSSGTRPRMSYALKMVSRAATTLTLVAACQQPSLVVVELVDPPARPSAHAEEVAHHAGGVYPHPHGRGARVGQRDRDLEQRELVALDEMEDLDVEGEAVEAGHREEEAGHVGTER